MTDEEVCGLIGAYVFFGLAIWSGILAAGTLAARITPQSRGAR